MTETQHECNRSCYAVVDGSQSNGGQTSAEFFRTTPNNPLPPRISVPCRNAGAPSTGDISVVRSIPPWSPCSRPSSGLPLTNTTKVGDGNVKGVEGHADDGVVGDGRHQVDDAALAQHVEASGVGRVVDLRRSEQYCQEVVYRPRPPHKCLFTVEVGSKEC